MISEPGQQHHQREDHHGDHGDGGDGHHGGHHHGGARISTPAERALLAPFSDDVHRFVAAALAGIDGPVAEIGAGDGVIADRLRADGFDVVAIDANADTAAAATAQGRDVQHGDWLSWQGAGRAPFAALIFTRSLHHIEPIEQAVEQMLRLAPGGLLIADEFGFERVDEAGAQMLVDGRALIAAAAMSDKEPAAIADPVGAWQHRMTVEHRVTPSDRLLDAVGQVAEIEQLAHGRFIARFLTQAIDPEHPQAAAVRDLLIATEDTRIAAGTLTPAGLRLVARLHTRSR